jgi:hypothetical protein
VHIDESHGQMNVSQRLDLPPLPQQNASSNCSRFGDRQVNTKDVFQHVHHEHKHHYRHNRSDRYEGKRLRYSLMDSCFLFNDFTMSPRETTCQTFTRIIKKQRPTNALVLTRDIRTIVDRYFAVRTRPTGWTGAHECGV